MDASKILSDLRSEREKVNEAISSLERLARGRSKQRGRPPKWMTAAPPQAAAVPKRRGRPPGSKNKKEAEK